MKGKIRIKKFLAAAVQGKLVLRLGLEKYLLQILFFFLIALLYISINLGMEGTIHRKEQNKEVLKSLRSVHTELTCQITGLNSVCKVENMLKQMDSEVKMPVKQAVIVDKAKK